MNLIERIERAQGPSRELDAEVFIVTCWPDWRIQTYCGDFPEQVRPGRIQEPNGCGWRNAPAYSASLDAAMSLVPEGWRPYSADMSVKGRTRFLIEGPKTQWATDNEGEGCAGNDWYSQGIAATPALALVAAALRSIGDTHDD